LQQGLDCAGEFDGVVLALPVALDDCGVAQSATYPGLFGPVEAIFADLFSTPWVVINDAVLAAVGGAVWERTG
jgi:predicted NBD/HSP70 family sugar kinase